MYLSTHTHTNIGTSICRHTCIAIRTCVRACMHSYGQRQTCVHAEVICNQSAMSQFILHLNLVHEILDSIDSMAAESVQLCPAEISRMKHVVYFIVGVCMAVLLAVWL